MGGGQQAGAATQAAGEEGGIVRAHEWAGISPPGIIGMEITTMKYLRWLWKWLLLEWSYQFPKKTGKR